MTAYEILAKMSKSGVVAPPTVYRALEKLIKDGIIHKIESLNAFVICHETCEAHKNQNHSSQFAICKSCGNAEEIHDHSLHDYFAKWASKNGFQLEAETIELSGLCKECS